MLAAFLGAMQFALANNGPKQSKTSPPKCPYGHCATLLEGGNRCDKCALSNNPYCSYHSKPHKKAPVKA